MVIGATRANVATLMRSLKRKVALDDDEVQVKVVSFCRQLF